MNTPLLMFLTFVAITLAITYWASKRTKTTTEFYSAGRSITGPGPVGSSQTGRRPPSMPGGKGWFARSNLQIRT